jgi:hypothetical protein
MNDKDFDVVSALIEELKIMKAQKDNLIKALNEARCDINYMLNTGNILSGVDFCYIDKAIKDVSNE